MNRSLVILTTGLDYGGAETQLTRIAIGLRKRGWQVRVISMLEPKAFQPILEAVGIEVDSLHMTRGYPSLGSFIKFCRLIKLHRPSVVLGFMVHANILARLARPFARMPVLVCSARNVEERNSHGSVRWRDLVYRLTDFLCDLTVQNSQAGRNRYIDVRAVSPKKVVVIPNGLDLDSFKPSEESRIAIRESLGVREDTFVWLAVGRLEPQKGYPLMLEALALLPDVWDLQLVIVGKGIQCSSLKSLAKRLGVTHKVRFYGVTENVRGLMCATDALLLSSEWEGLPNVLIEAAAMELPSVTTDVGGSSEVVLHRMTGVVVKERTAAEVAKAMEMMMSLGSDSLRKMGKAARDYAMKSFDINKVLTKWEEVLTDDYVRKSPSER